LPASFDRSSKIQLLSQAALIGIFTFILTSFVIPAINANSEDIDELEKDVQKINIKITDFEDVDKKLNEMDTKLDKIVLGMCGEFGGKHCD